MNRVDFGFGFEFVVVVVDHCWHSKILNYLGLVLLLATQVVTRTVK